MRRADWLVLGAIGLAAAIARLIGLGRRGLWVDEAFTALVARSPEQLVELLRHDSGPPLYYVLVSAWSALAGTSEGALRAPSAIAGIASAVVVALATRRLGGGISGMLVAGAAVALAPLAVHHAQDARYYAFLPLISAACLLALDRALVSGGSRRWVALTLLLVAGAYLHAYGLLLVPASFAYARIAHPRARLGPLVIAAVATVAAFSPWAPIFLEQIRSGGTAWAGREAGANAPLASLEAFIPGGRTPPHVAIAWAPPRALVLAAGALLSMGALAGAIRARDRRSAGAALYALVPMALLALLTLALPVYVVARGDLLFLPGIWIALALGLERLGPRAALLGAVLVAIIGTVALVPLHRSDLKSGDRALAGAIGERAGPGDVVVAAGLSYAPLLHYLQRAPVVLVPFPEEMRVHPGNLDVRAAMERPQRSFDELDRALATALATADAETRIFAALPPGGMGLALGQHLDRRLARVRRPEPVFRMGVLGTPITLGTWRAVPLRSDRP